MLVCFAVWKCAVSPTGDRLYIISWDQNTLLTLARDGTLLATYTDPATTAHIWSTCDPCRPGAGLWSPVQHMYYRWAGRERVSWLRWLLRCMECGGHGQSATAAPHHPSLWDSITETTSWCSE
ncbi:hypothetical protein DPMN_018605 [Dreissena polymorpha]|uniref:Uncharacterized protein n=1 Tax=Dreissena polymorpha TaxID=45954 RepID=A0A9D4S8I7_DREPO|nr:hypothetical protein DPMN_018605 [Dreissena polymorpha]